MLKLVLNCLLNFVLNFPLHFVLKFFLNFILTFLLNFVLNFLLHFVLNDLLKFVVIFFFQFCTKFFATFCSRFLAKSCTKFLRKFGTFNGTSMVSLVNFLLNFNEYVYSSFPTYSIFFLTNIPENAFLAASWRVTNDEKIPRLLSRCRFSRFTMAHRLASAFYRKREQLLDQGSHRSAKWRSNGRSTQRLRFDARSHNGCLRVVQSAVSFSHKFVTMKKKKKKSHKIAWYVSEATFVSYVATTK